MKNDNNSLLIHTNLKLHMTICAGTAGVWRISALNEAGGWKDRTTVEDMDLAVRASLRGWKFVYLSDLKVKVLLMITKSTLGKVVYLTKLIKYFEIGLTMCSFKSY